MLQSRGVKDALDAHPILLLCLVSAVIMHLKNSPLTYWLGSVVWAAAIFWASSQSNLPETGMDLPLYTDKIVHAVIYAILAHLLLFAMIRSGMTWLGAALFAVILASFYGITDEWHQSTVPGRTADVFDWLADTVGASLVFIIALKRT